MSLASDVRGPHLAPADAGRRDKTVPLTILRVPPEHR
jgi:hypothetical protein